LVAWVLGVNRFLPGTIAVTKALWVPDTFHARFSAKARSYRYYFYQAPVADPFKRHMTCIHRPLDIAAMQAACTYLLGKHDFSSFRAAQCQARSPIRTITEIGLVSEGDCWYLNITADAFLHHMVRNIMGVLFEIGLGRAPVAWAADVLAARSRTKAARTAPPQGLCLWVVHYGAADPQLYPGL
jgi:tRNA pseudouridine38-40 synthase